ncbi:phosphoesterase PA-phosphatase [Actinoplanes sp. NPDC051411]|uniref:phosphoesterase PA-phosphatase n=1 Tax=Actinoplanes sp. NPDC051411 TaxID=3155522 RepID=UPI00341D5337
MKALRVLARVVTEASTPTLLVGLLLPLIGYESGGYRGLWLGLLASVFSAVVPFVFVLRRTRSGRLSDHHVRNRADRAVPLLVSLLSVMLGFALLTVLHAPRQLLAVMIAGVAGIVITIAVTHWWKISIHTGAASGCTTVLAMTFGVAALPAFPILVVIGWSRVVLREHTVAQVVAGAAVGALTTGVVLTMLNG